MKSFYVYILECADLSYYVGVTNDIDRRFYEHQSGKNTNSYTYKRRPVKLVFVETFSDINDAIAFEKQIKGWSRNKKEAIIAGNWYALKGFSECKNDSHWRNKEEE